MPKTTSENPADYIVPLNMNGLDGRMLHMPAPTGKNRETLVIYGHHSMLERWWGLAQNLNEFGAVTMPDMPGFGGMDSFYKIGRRPNIDAYADYLAAFVKLRFRRKRVTIVGISFGFLVVTRMLQRYPELAKKVDVLVAMVGFMHRDDFLFTPRQRNLYRRISRVFATRPVAVFIRYVGLNRPVINTFTKHMPNSKRRFIEVTAEEFDKTVDFDVQIWQANDVRTHWLTTSEFLNIDNCSKRINLPVYHVISSEEHYFDNEVVKQHMLVVFQKYHKHMAKSKAHTPSILGDKKAMRTMVPPGLRRVLSEDV
jgi:pimeloyl-ACP methyl ester carboxylesterase